MFLREGGRGAEQAGLGMGDELDRDRGHQLLKAPLGDEALAEDIVQDTLAVAWDNQRQFRGEAGLKTWVMAILKNKITDHFRRSRHGGISLEGLQRENEAIDEAWRACFDADGHWLDSASPAQWRPPEDYAEQQDFFRTLENCLGGLPEDTANAVAFLCSQEAAYITAESLNVSGGEEPH